FGGGSSSGSPSISKAQKEIEKNPKNAQAYRDLARAYEEKSQDIGAIGALETYIKLRPKDASALRELAAEYDTRARLQTVDAQAAGFDAQAAQGSTFGPTPTSPLGKAFSANPDPIQQAVSQAANTRYNDTIQQLQSTYKAQAEVFKKLVKLDPTDS